MEMSNVFFPCLFIQMHFSTLFLLKSSLFISNENCGSENELGLTTTVVIIIIAVLSVLVVILLIIIIIVLCLKKKKKEENVKETVDENPYYDESELYSYGNLRTNVVDENDYY